MELRDGTFPGNHGSNVLGIVTFPKGGCPEPRCPFLSGNKERDHTAAPMLDRIPGLRHEPQKVGKIGGAFCKSIVDGKAQPFFIRGLALGSQPSPIVEKMALAMQLGIEDHGQVIFQTNPVREPPHSAGRANEIPELPGMIQRGGIVVNVVMDVLAVCVGSNEKGILALRPAHRRFIADAVGLLRGDLSGLESLPDLIAKHIGIPALLPARDGPVLCLA